MYNNGKVRLSLFWYIGSQSLQGKYHQKCTEWIGPLVSCC
jgi:hypothetical protein